MSDADALQALQQAARDGQLAVVVGRDRPGSDNAPSLGADNLMSWQIAPFVQIRVQEELALATLYEAVAALPVQFWLTTSYGPTLPAALAAVKEPNIHLVDDNWLDRRLNHPDLIRLCGEAAHPARLVVTAPEYRALPDAARLQLYDRARQWVSANTVLFIACDPAPGSDFSRRVFPHLLQKPGAFGQGAYLLWPDATPADVARWAARGITVLPTQPVPFLQELAAALDGVIAVDPETDRFARLAQKLGAGASAAEIAAEVQTIPKAARAKKITITFTLRLDPQEELLFTLDIAYKPDMRIDYDPKNLAPCGVTLAELQQWARAAEIARNNALLPDEEAAWSLFNRLLPAGSEHRRKYSLALFMSRQLPAPISIVFNLGEAQSGLWSVPWELLHDGKVEPLEAGAQGRGFLGLNYAAYRWLSAVTSVEQVVGAITRALIVAADPTQQLAGLDEEVDWLQQTLQEQGLAVDVLRPDDDVIADPAAIAQRLRNDAYDLFHFVGHGQLNPFDPTQSALVLGRRQQQEIGVLLPVNAIVQAARDGQLKFVFLSACEVGEAGVADEERPWEEAGVLMGLLRAGVPAAAGMRWQVGDDNSRQLAARFYQALLHDGESGETALMLARRALANAGEADWANPLLAKAHDSLTAGR